MIDTEAKTVISPSFSRLLWAEWEFSNLLEILRLYAEKFCRLVGHAQSAGLQCAMFGDDPRNSEITLGMIETLLPLLHEMRIESERIGLEATGDAVTNLLERWEQYHDVRVFAQMSPQILLTVESEFKRKVCFILPRSSQELYEKPCEGWEPILSTFPDARGDIEEMNRCMAFNRYPAAVFHVLLAVEHGIIALGRFVGVSDPKPGWDATCNAVARILDAGRKTAAPDILKHFAFLEVVNKDMQSMKMAWRNKVSHAANHLAVMTSDFKPEVAEKIISACHGFMLIVATESQNKK